MARQTIAVGAFGPVYVNETATRQTIASSPVYINETVAAAAAKTPGVPNDLAWPSILGTWNPPDPSPFIGGRQPLEPARLNASLIAVRVDLPPIPVFENPIIAVSWAWIPPDPLPQLNRGLSPAIPGRSVDNPSPRLVTTPAGVVLAWLPPDPQPQVKGPLSPGIPGQSVDIPPAGRLDRLHAIRATWLPADPQPQRQQIISAGVPGQSVDNPPRLARPVIVWGELTLPPTVLRPGVPRQVSIAIQVPFGAPWLSTVIGAWTPIDWMRITAQKPSPSLLFTKGATSPGPPEFTLLNQIRRARTLANLEGRPNALVNLIRRMGRRP